MADSISLEAYADRIDVTYDIASPPGYVKRSYDSSISYADALVSITGGGPYAVYEDETVVQGWSYYYWVTDAGGTPVAGPVSAQLTVPTLIGKHPRRGRHNFWYIHA